MRRTTLISALSLVATGLLLAASAVAGPKGKGDDHIKVHLKGFEEVPVVVTGATGELHLTINDAAGTIDYELTYENLEGNVTQAHIHVGQKNVVGGISIWLCKTPGTVPMSAAVAAITPFCPSLDPHSGTVSGTVSAANVIGPTGQAIPAGDLDDVLTAIRAGKAYGNVHSTSAPGGEVRGQLH
jgi:hypothetical protein